MSAIRKPKTIDDIPEMQLLFRATRGGYKPLTGRNLATKFKGRYYFDFIVIGETIQKKKRKTERKYYILANGEQYHLYVLWCFANLHFKELDFLVEGDFTASINTENFPNFFVAGGGEVEVTKKQIRMYGSSADYGKYNIKVARPIVERYITANFPDISEIILE